MINTPCFLKYHLIRVLLCKTHLPLKGEGFKRQKRKFRTKRGAFEKAPCGSKEDGAIWSGGLPERVEEDFRKKGLPSGKQEKGFLRLWGYGVSHNTP